MLNQLWHDLWVPVFIVLILIGIFAGQGFAIGLGVMGLLFAGIARLWNKVSLEEVSYERELSQRRVFIDEEFSMKITLTNKKPVPLGRVQIEDDMPNAISILDGDVVSSPSPDTITLRHSTSISWYERIHWDYTMKCSRRGFFRFGPTRLESGDIFGFFSSRSSVRGSSFVLVYPRVYPLPEMGIDAARPLGDARGGIRIFEDYSRPLSIRDYHRGDPLKTIDWKATAKAAQLQVNTYEPSSATTVIVVVVVETSSRYWEGYSPTNLERVIVAAASIASYASEKEYSLGLFSNGTPIIADRPMRIAPNRSPEQLTVILEALATIRPLAMGPMPAQLAEHSRRFPLGATLVIVAALINEEMQDNIHTLKRNGYKVVVIYVGDGKCPEMVEGTIVHELQDFFAEMELASAFGPR